MAWLVLLIVLAGGCTRDLVWTRADFTQEQFQRERYDCMRQATYTSVLGAGGILVASPQVDDELYIECMRARGWRLEERVR